MRQPVPFGKYLLLDRISVGGMAEVFKAKSYGVEGFEKIIAIKRILPTMGEDRDFIKMFIDEAKIAGQLAHANICQIFELGRIDGSHFIAMEFIWGKDLLQIQNRLRKLKQPMPIPMACFAIAKVLEGLDYAHRKRDPLGRPLEIVHRDCSPQNVLVSYEGEVKVIDFGIAKATSRNSRTMAGVLKGKFGYMSPEQVRGLPLDRRSDIFAIGTMLYECLIGDRLFQGETDFSTLEKVRNVDIKSPREMNPAIPEAIDRVIMKALAKDVDERYQWCSEMLADLQQFLMSQEHVFTAKSLAGWLKEGFGADLEKERALLEQYKRVGRDGLIAGVPAAEAKLDVVEHLGEAPQIAESDATQLGGPSFDDIEKELAAIASPEGAKRKATHAGHSSGNEVDGDFGEELPTEIFGDEHGAAAAAAMVAKPAAAVGSAGISAAPRLPGLSPNPAPARAPNAPPLRPPPGYGAPSTGPVPRIPPLSTPPAGSMSRSATTTPPPAMPPVPAPPPQIQIGAGAPPGGANDGRTLMGAVAPAGLPNYSNGNYPRVTNNQVAAQQQPPPMMFDPNTGYPLHPPQQQQPVQQQQQPQPQAYGSNDAWQQSPQQSQPMQQQQPYASDPNMAAYGQYGQQNYNQQGYGQQPTNGYGQNGQHNTFNQSGPMPVPAIAAPVEGKRKGSLGRDIAIGVAIAVVVLGGFLAVKFLVLGKKAATVEVADGSGGGGSAAVPAPTGIATLKISLPGGLPAQLFIDDKMVGNFGDKAEVQTTAGMRKVRLVRDDQKCERDLKLEADKPNVFDCVMPAPPAPTITNGSAAAGSAGSAAVDSGSAGIAGTQQAGSGSATTIVATAAGSGSAAMTVKQPDPMPVEKKKPPEPVVAPPPVVHEKKPEVPRPIVEVKKPPVEKPASDKGYLEVYSTPKAKILVDGADTGMSTPIGGHALPLSPGRHKITFIVGEDRFTFPATVKAGATEVMKKELN